MTFSYLERMITLHKALSFWLLNELKKCESVPTMFNYKKELKDFRTKIPTKPLSNIEEYVTLIQGNDIRYFFDNEMDIRLHLYKMVVDYLFEGEQI